MATNKTRSRTQREERLTEVAALHRRGMKQTEIAKAVGVSQPQIAYDLRIVQTRYQATQMKDRSALVAEKLAQYRDVGREAWLAYDRSKEDAGTVVEEFVVASESDGTREGSERRIRRVVTKAGRLPANQYLLTILSVLKAECELLGLDPERPVAQNNLNLVVAGAEFWSNLAQQVAAQLPTVEQRVAMAIEAEPES
jgi:plasmid maintenance system antidote protein VapI